MNTNYLDYSQQNPITAAWLNDANNITYGMVWARLNGVTGGLTQSWNVASLVKVGVGTYTINFSQKMQLPTNCYTFGLNGPGLAFVTAETQTSITFQTTTTAGLAQDFTGISVQIMGIPALPGT